MSPDSARVFFALWPDEGTRAGLAKWGRAIHRESGGRLMQTVDLHMTLAFLGDVALERLDTLRIAVAGVAPRRFVLPIDRPGYWPRNRIAWAGANETPPVLAELVDELRAALVGASVRFDGKAFVPHVTLIRDARPGFTLPALPAIEWPVRSFALVRSTGNTSPRYKVEAEWSAPR